MRGAFLFFDGLVQAKLVRNGVDEALRDGGNTFNTVYAAMLLQVARDFAGLPDVRTLKAHEIKFFYEGLRAELKAGTAPKG